MVSDILQLHLLGVLCAPNTNVDGQFDERSDRMRRKAEISKEQEHDQPQDAYSAESFPSNILIASKRPSPPRTSAASPKYPHVVTADTKLIKETRIQ